MMTSALGELQLAALPAAIGTTAIVYSNIIAMKLMGKVRYDASTKGEQEVHPYKPWADTRSDSEPHFRAFKACQNVTEWTVYSVPTLWLYVLYPPAIPAVGFSLSCCGALLGLGLGLVNVQYVKGYTMSADARIPPFKRRAMMMRVLFYGSIAGMVCSAAGALGLM